MTDMKSLDERLAHIEKVLPSLSTFNLNVFAILGKAVKELDANQAKLLRGELAGLKNIQYENLEAGLIDSQVDAVIQMIFESKIR